MGIPYIDWQSYTEKAVKSDNKLTYDKKLDSLGDLNFKKDLLYKLRSIKCFLDESAAGNKFEYNKTVTGVAQRLRSL